MDLGSFPNTHGQAKIIQTNQPHFSSSPLFLLRTLAIDRQELDSFPSSSSKQSKTNLSNFHFPLPFLSLPWARSRALSSPIWLFQGRGLWCCRAGAVAVGAYQSTISFVRCVFPPQSPTQRSPLLRYPAPLSKRWENSRFSLVQNTHPKPLSRLWC